MLLLLGATLSCLPAFALAGTGNLPPSPNPEEELQLGARAEENGAFERALDYYHASLDGRPSPRLARAARNRIMWIEERAEGGFVPLATLARVRRDQRALANPAALEALAAEVESFPPGRVRSELRLRVAEARLSIHGRRTAALAGLGVILDDPTSGDSDRVLAERDLVSALLADHRLDDAREEVQEHPFDPTSAAQVARLVRRRALERTVEAGLLALLVLGLGVATWWPRHRRRPDPASHCDPSGAL